MMEILQHMNDDYIAAGYCLDLLAQNMPGISQSDKSDIQKNKKL